MIVKYTKSVLVKTQLYLDDRVNVYKRVTCFYPSSQQFQKTHIEEDIVL